MFGLNNLAEKTVDSFLHQGIVNQCHAKGYEVDADSVASVLLTRWSARRARKIALEQFADRRQCSFGAAVRMLNEDPDARADFLMMEIDWDEMMGFLMKLLELLLKLM